MRFARPVVSALIVLASGALPLWASEPGKDEGKELYGKKCAMCHGADGVAKAMAKGSGNFNDPAWQKKMTDDAIADVISHGKNKMPKNDKLTPEQVRSIVEFVRTLWTQK